MREICTSGLTRGEAAQAPLLLYWRKPFWLTALPFFFHFSLLAFLALCLPFFNH
jgi:hypothetical protein